MFEQLSLAGFGTLLIIVGILVWLAMRESSLGSVAGLAIGVLGALVVFPNLVVPAARCGFFNVWEIFNPETWNTVFWGPADWFLVVSQALLIVAMIATAIYAAKENEEKPFGVVVVITCIYAYAALFPAIPVVDSWMQEQGLVKVPACVIHTTTQVETSKEPEKPVSEQPKPPEPSPIATIQVLPTPTPAPTIIYITKVVTVEVPIASPIATTKNVPCGDPPQGLSSYALLVLPLVAEKPSKEVPQVFAEGSVETTLKGGLVKACIAADPKGTGQPEADDLVEIEVTMEDGERSSRSFNFYDADTTGIKRWPAQDITDMFKGSGKIRISIKAWDTAFPYRSVKYPLYVVFWSVAP